MTEINIKVIRKQFKKWYLWKDPKQNESPHTEGKHEEKKKPARNWDGKIVRKWKRMATLLICLTQTGNYVKWDRMKCNHISSIPIHSLCILLLPDPSKYQHLWSTSYQTDFHLMSILTFIQLIVPSKSKIYVY
jgi:hypothetical protein